MKNSEQAAVRQQELSLTLRLSELEAEVLRRASKIQNRPMNVHNLHGIIGSKNDEYADVYRARFFGPEEFIAHWLEGLMIKAKQQEEEAIRKYGHVSYPSAARRILDLLRDEQIQEYTLLFLERNFYRQLSARIRDKPDDKLWSLWFGSNQLPWGLLIAGSFWQDEWRSTPHKVRHAGYAYWTIGHVLEEGLVVPGDPQAMRFQSVDEILQFYRQVLARISNSPYEREIADLYVDYILNSPDASSEPFLIPEFRYAGLAAKHLYRVDYAVFNVHTMRYTGFELSPHSTHMAVSGIKSQTQTALNAKLAVQWAKEMDKRNRYFQTFDLPIITFTDQDLLDVPACFSTIAGYLRNRPAAPISVNQQLKALQAFK